MKELDKYHYVKFANDNKLCYWLMVTPPSGECIDVYATVFHNNKLHEDVLVAQIWEEGYYIVSAWISPVVDTKVLLRLFFKTAMKIRFLNGDSSVDLAYGYLDALCKDFIDVNGLVYDRERLYEIVEDAYSVELDVSSLVEMRKWLWNGVYATLPSKVKSSIRMTHKNTTAKEKTMRSIEDAISKLSNQKKFITVSAISDLISKPEVTVRKYMELFRDEIDSINISNFDTSNFHSYVRDENVNNIIMAIRELHSANKRLSKTDVADIADLSRMTIHRLWEDERIQKIMKDYNNLQTA